jgi:phosphopantothenoylcysteine decarboxylase/phosphopantothenate--cysteine ligase
MVEPEEILEAVRQLLAKQGDLAGRHVVVTAGGTREALDPVRYLTNRSSGKMGYALAEAARDRGAEVTLISTTNLPLPRGVKLVAVDSAAQMKEAVLAVVSQADALVMAAAVADYRPAHVAEHKIKKADDDLTLALGRTEDILMRVAQQRDQTARLRCVVGFAAETQSLLDHAAQKLARKKLDYIVANDVSRNDSGFAVDTNQVTIIGADETVETLPLLSKVAVADEIWNRVVKKLAHGSGV